MSPFSLFPKPQTRTVHMTTRQHFSSQPRKVTTCFVLDDCGDDSETFANTVDGEVSFSMEPTKQTSPTQKAFNAVDTREENILNIHTVEDDDGPWSSGDEHKSGRNTRFKNGTCCGLLSRDVLRYYRRQVVCRQTCANFSLGHRRHYDVDATTPVSQRKTDDACSSGRKRVSSMDSKKAPRENEALDSWHDAKTALYVATGSESMFLTTHEGDIRRRS